MTSIMGTSLAHWSKHSARTKIYVWNNSGDDDSETGDNELFDDTADDSEIDEYETDDGEYLNDYDYAL